MDNIEIPNINHFPVLGSSGGSLSIIYADLLEDVTFYAGGYPVYYTDMLSSIMDIRLREGNRSQFQGQLDLNFSGFGGVLEGPAGGGKGSFLLAARRSYLDFLTEFMGFGVTPSYGDGQFKFVYDLNQSHKLVLVNVLGYDINHISREQSGELEMPTYGSDEHLENTFEINWQALWNNKGYSHTTFSHIYTEFNRDFTEYGTDNHLIDLVTTEQFIQIRNENMYKINPSHSLRFGTSLKIMTNDYNNFYGEYRDALGNLTPEFSVNRKVAARDYATFLNYSFRPVIRLETTCGIRGNILNILQIGQ